MKRFLFNHVERLHESFLQQDPGRSGNVSRDMAYAICRGAKLPVNKDLLNAVLDKYVTSEHFKYWLQNIKKKKFNIFAVMLFNESVTEFVRMKLEKLITGTYWSF